MAIKPIPVPSAGMVYGDGKPTVTWYQWFQSLVARGGAVAPVTVGASPFTYTASERGFAVVTGGTVTNIDFVRGSTTINVTGQQTTALGAGDSLVVTYAVAPTFQFVPV
jgi:hypothetical protein